MPKPTTDADKKHPTLRDAVSPLALTGLDPPLWLQNSSYPAALDRLLIASALQTGAQGPAELVVSQRAAGANMSVDVAPGRAVIPVTDSPNQGSALVRSTAVNNLVISGAPAAGLSRIDRIIARVYDASLIGGSINGWQLEVVTGTPAVSAVGPTLPPSSISLARLLVAAGQASVVNANIVDERAMAGVAGTLVDVADLIATSPPANQWWAISGSSFNLPAARNYRVVAQVVASSVIGAVLQLSVQRDAAPVDPKYAFDFRGSYLTMAGEWILQGPKLGCFATAFMSSAGNTYGGQILVYDAGPAVTIT